MAEEYLTKEQRKKYLAELNQEQREVLNKYKKYKINSGLLTQVNQDGVFWQLQEELVNENYDFHNPKESPLVCSCGKHVKYLYICKASDSDQIKKLLFHNLCISIDKMIIWMLTIIKLLRIRRTNHE